MRYIKAVDLAMRRAKAYGETYIVYGVKRRWWFGYHYYYVHGSVFEIMVSNYPTKYVKFMMILSNGRVTQ